MLLERKVLAGTYCSSFNCVGQWGLWIALCASFNICHLKSHEMVVQVQMHNICDASEEGYDMCSYLRFIYDDGSISCSFPVGKSKPTQVRPITIPILELQAANLSVKVFQAIASE